MTIDGAIKMIQYRINTASKIAGRGADGKAFEDLEMAIQALEENQKFHAIGTIDEFKKLKEKSVPKKPIEKERYGLTVFDCPTCNAELYSGQRFCDECGQSILDDYE